ncbi:TPA: ABC transporter permease subunit [Klebsiella pneumoniae]|uniref:ABC transporter permease n=1 Tax=Klebsiella pneumoniae TaxID=573 RepID=UPI001C705C30|nr:ABC transporter permease subunit [Klebsiella pneumoniae]HCA9919021.1 ABC transporter permease subunit [Klebsiella pneumoniae]HCB0113206.1 ABC transporter permease subunit [Klebsiella pneumoniae]HCU1212913.1 ABC transporter permease subunit [Klebsiella pneumoniae]
MPQGYAHMLLDGILITVRLSLGALVVSMLLGLLMALARISASRTLNAIATLYTTVIRGIPDLALMLLVYYSLQIGLNQVTDSLGWQQLDIDPFSAGVLTLGVIYGAYFTETFRGAFIAVPCGQLEAGRAFGLSGWQCFYLLMFPQMMRFALPGLSNNWLILVKATALVSLIGLSDVTKAAQNAGKGSGQLFFYLVLAALFYLLVTTVSSLVLWWLSKRYNAGVREAEL